MGSDGPVCVSGAVVFEPVNLVRCVRACLWSGGVLVPVLLVAGGLWLGLLALGDETGSRGALGVALVALVGLVIDLIALVVVLALIELKRHAEPADHS